METYPHYVVRNNEGQYWAIRQGIMVDSIATPRGTAVRDLRSHEIVYDGTLLNKSMYSDNMSGQLIPLSDGKLGLYKTIVQKSSYSLLHYPENHSPENAEQTIKMSDFSKYRQKM